MKINGKNTKIQHFLIAILYLGVWQLAYMLVQKEILIASPISVFNKILELVGERNFYSSILHSFTRIFAGFTAGILVGTILSYLTYKSKLLYAILSPGLGIIKSTPVASFIILALLWMNNSNLTIFICFLMVLPLVWKNLHEGLSNTDNKLLEMATIFKFSELKIIRAIYIPQIQPYLYSAITISLGFAWKSGIAAEVIANPNPSIGRMLYNAKIYIETPDVFAWTIIVIILSMSMEKIVVHIFNYLMLDKGASND